MNYQLFNYRKSGDIDSITNFIRGTVDKLNFENPLTAARELTKSSSVRKGVFVSDFQHIKERHVIEPEQMESNFVNPRYGGQPQAAFFHKKEDGSLTPVSEEELSFLITDAVYDCARDISMALATSKNINASISYDVSEAVANDLVCIGFDSECNLIQTKFATMVLKEDPSDNSAFGFKMKTFYPELSKGEIMETREELVRDDGFPSLTEESVSKAIKQYAERTEERNQKFEQQKEEREQQRKPRSVKKGNRTKAFSVPYEDSR